MDLLFFDIFYEIKFINYFNQRFYSYIQLVYRDNFQLIRLINKVMIEKKIMINCVKFNKKY